MDGPWWMQSGLPSSWCASFSSASLFSPTQLAPTTTTTRLRSSSSWCLLSIHLAFGKPPLLHFWAAAYDDSASMDHHWNPSHHYHHHAWAFGGGGETSPVVYDSSHPHFLVRSMNPINECAIISSLFLLHSELLLLPYHPSHLVAFTIWISRLFLFLFQRALRLIFQSHYYYWDGSFIILSVCVRFDIRSPPRFFANPFSLSVWASAKKRLVFSSLRSSPWDSASRKVGAKKH